MKLQLLAPAGDRSDASQSHCCQAARRTNLAQCKTPTRNNWQKALFFSSAKLSTFRQMANSPLEASVTCTTHQRECKSYMTKDARGGKPRGASREHDVHRATVHCSPFMWKSLQPGWLGPNSRHLEPLLSH